MNGKNGPNVLFLVVAQSKKESAFATIRLLIMAEVIVAKMVLRQQNIRTVTKIRVQVG